LEKQEHKKMSINTAACFQRCYRREKTLAGKTLKTVCSHGFFFPLPFLSLSEYTNAIIMATHSLITAMVIVFNDDQIFTVAQIGILLPGGDF